MHYVVIDEEFCKVAKGARTSEFSCGHEIIQIGAVLLDDAFNVTSSFDEYVNPEYGYVDAFISRLTGINQYMVSKADRLEAVLDRFLNWIPEDSVMVSWSMSDRMQLQKETVAKKIWRERLSMLFDGWIDSQAIFTEKANVSRKYNLQEALNISGVAMDGNEHNGLDDARNTAALFGMMMQPEFVTCSSYIKADSEQEELSFSLGSLFAGLGFVV